MDETGRREISDRRVDSQYVRRAAHLSLHLVLLGLVAIDHEAAYQAQVRKVHSK